MRVCLLAPGDTLPRWQADALTHLLVNTDAEVTSVVYDEYEADRTTVEAIKRGVELREWAVVATLSDALAGPMPERDRVPLADVVDLEAVPTWSVEPRIVDGWKREIPAAVAEAVADKSDIGLRYAFGFLVGPILTALEHGILSFHHGDLREYRGQPMGFWEFVNGDDEVGITVQLIDETLDAGRVAALKRVPIGDLHTWETVKRRLLSESEDMLTRSVRAVEAGTIREPDSLGNLYTHPKGRPVATFAARNAIGRVREVVGAD
ncbi:formyltransferase family protein [Halobaculum marinum]|uniref:Formyltransferase family protein n=1 Tax=Halobaculum marinum TaxID=3031996 RepID=A0ABD5WWU4_9EURY|nr:formyltransferase family protein [Halobaculum sp. DT55]